MNPVRIVSFAICAAFFLDFAQTLVYFSEADAYLWKMCLASIAIEFGFLTLFAERDVSALVAGVVVSVFLLIDSLSRTVFAAQCVASFLLHYLVETLVDTVFRAATLCFLVPSVVMSQTMMVSACDASHLPLCALTVLFAVQSVLKWFRMK